MRAVLDTSTLVSAIRSRLGASAALLDLILAGTITLLMNFNLSCEYREVVLRPEHVAASYLSFDQLVDLLNTLEKLSEAVEVAVRHRPLSVDPDDDRILDLAINGAADLIVTANLRHLREPASRFGIEVVEAKTLLFRIR